MSPTPASQLPGSGQNDPFMDQDAQYRILLIDDHSIVQVALQQILRSQAVESPGGTYPSQAGRSTSRPKYLVDSCFTGEEGLTLLRASLAESLPYSVAFVDLHLGDDDWDGLYTIQQLWALAPDLQVILCSAMKDSTWKNVVDELGYTDRLLILKKPFDRAEVLQLACALTRKWAMTRHIHRQTEFLQEMVTARTEQLTRLNTQLQRTNQELEQARDVAVRASRSKSEFLANVSHEIRTPLTAILGFSELMLDNHPDQPQQADFLQTIHRNASKLLAMVDDLLELSRMEVDRLTVDFADCCPTEILTVVGQMLAAEATARGLTARVEIAPEVPAVLHTAPLRLHQILLNLIINAVKFTESGSIRLSARRRIRAEADWLEIEVTDTGIGIPESFQQEMFDNFAQADTSSTRRRGGIGLGLALSKRLAERLGGDLLVESQEGIGSSFVLVLPIPGPLHRPHRVAPGESMASGPVLELAAPIQPEVHFRARALLMDTTPISQRLKTHHLQSLGISVVHAPGIELAVELVQAGPTKPFDVAFLSGCLPEDVRALRAAGYEGPIFALLSNRHIDTIREFRNAGCRDVLFNPAGTKELARILMQHCPHLLAIDQNTPAPLPEEG